MDVNYIYDLLIELGMFTKEELDLVIYINGFNFDTLEDCLYARYGYRSVDQFLEELEESEEEGSEEEEEE